MSGAVDELEAAKAELERLKAAYAADPKNWKLGEDYGFASQRLVWAKRAGKPRIPVAPRVVERRVSPNEWSDALPAHCVECDGWVRDEMTGDERQYPLKGYVLRVGELGVRCVLCESEWELEI